jgi:6,7-dimethyl-8-ribityllumazine synthase
MKPASDGLMSQAEFFVADTVRVAIVSARFYPDLADQLEEGARRACAVHGVKAEHYRIVRVAGCFELPLACRREIDAGAHVLVALGVVVRGETPHFEYVASGCAYGIMDVQLGTRVPIGFGVLTTNTLEQALERADLTRGNKGYEAMLAALRQV